jgi:hypothetical protein
VRKNKFLIILSLIVVLFSMQFAFAAVSITVNEPSSGWYSSYSIVLNISTNVNANATFNTSSYGTQVSLFANDVIGNFTLNSTYLIEGNNTITFLAVNYTNSSEQTSEVVSNVAVDLSAPSWDEAPSNRNLEFGSAFSYDVNATDAGIGVGVYSINDTTNFAIVSGTGVITNATALTVGTYLLNVSVNDSLNYVTSALFNLTVADSTAPTWTETPTNQTLEFGSAFSYDVNASDLGTLDDYFVNDTTNFAIVSGTGVITNNTALSVGTYWLNISVNDTYNNVLSQIITLLVNDSTAPTVSIALPNTTQTSSSVTLSATTNENAACRYSTTDGAYVNMSGNFTGATTTHTASLTLSNGDYVYYFRCNDTSGNLMTTSVNATFTVSIAASTSNGGRRRVCNDGRDNDGDGLIDLDDPGCDSRSDDDESNPLVVFEEEFSLASGDSVNWIIDSSEEVMFKSKGEDHTIKVVKIVDGFVTVVIHSKVSSATLSVGQLWYVDLDGDGNDYDLKVVVNSVEGDSADLTMEAITLAIDNSDPIIEAPKEESKPTKSFEPEAVSEEKLQDSTLEPEEDTKSYTLLIMILFVMIIAIVLVVYFFVYRKK